MQTGAISGDRKSAASVSSDQARDGHDDQQTYILQSSTRRVAVDVVVTGADGKPVTGLSERDFQITEDRKPQDIRSFEEHSPELDVSSVTPGPTMLPAHTFTNLEAVPASGPPVVVLLDFLNTPIDAQMQTRGQIERFLENKPGSLQIAIFTLSDDLSMLQGFTTDRERLRAAIRSKGARPHLASASEQLLRAQITLDAFVNLGRTLAAIPGRKNLLWFSGAFDMMVLPQAEDLRQGSLDMGRDAASPDSRGGPVVTSQNLLPSASADGEASSSGFSSKVGNLTVLQERLRNVATMLAVSQTAVYPVDVRGLQVETGFSAGGATPSQMTADPRGRQGTPGIPSAPGAPAPNTQSHNDFMQSLNAMHATMEEVANATGGRAFENSNGIAAAADAAIRDGSSYYALVYAPSNLRFDGGLRAIHVSVNKPECTLAYRSAYYADDEPGGKPAAASRGSLSAEMIHGAPEAPGLVFKAQIDPNGRPMAAPADSPLAVKVMTRTSVKAKNNPGLLSGMVQPYRIRLAIASRQLQFTTSDDAVHHTTIEIAVSAFTADGRKVSSTEQNLDVTLPMVVFLRAMQDGMFHSLEVNVPVEATSLRLAVRDTLSHRTGSLELALPLDPVH